MAAVTEDQITIIAEDAEAEAAAAAAEQRPAQQSTRSRADKETLSTELEEAAAAAAGSGSLMQFDKSQRNPSQQLRHGADGGGSSRRKSSVRMSTQLTTPQFRQQRKGAAGASPDVAKLDNFLDEVPQPSRPRFSSTMSLEAQFAMMKAYESRLRTKILTANPEFANVLHESPDPPAELKRPTVSLRQRPATSRDPAAARAAAAAASAAAVAAAEAVGKRKSQRSQSLAPDRSQISEETQLDLARRLQYAQYLSDYFVSKQGEPCLNHGLLRNQKDFNPIKKFNWWSSWWSRDFEFQEEEEPEGGSAAVKTREAP